MWYFKFCICTAKGHGLCGRISIPARGNDSSLRTTSLIQPTTEVSFAGVWSWHFTIRGYECQGQLRIPGGIRSENWLIAKLPSLPLRQEWVNHLLRIAVFCTFFIRTRINVTGLVNYLVCSLHLGFIICNWRWNMPRWLIKSCTSYLFRNLFVLVSIPVARNFNSFLSWGILALRLFAYVFLRSAECKEAY